MPLKKEVKEAIEGLDMDSAVKVGKYMQNRDGYEKEQQIIKLGKIISTWDLTGSLTEHLYKNGVRVE